ncbi:8-oxo-dGTP diphosphatase [Nocardioides ginsengisegetis]|uniref:8-oxo-dGTP diphosphatase n=1 Tax=Nocardioides ginsengisegetis TaxID=661491 RepID=A0A7W3PA92_9ACTN|nr:8-oxo-dGTP diphosphatase [Nocardioides ginsengisegetis]
MTRLVVGAAIIRDDRVLAARRVTPPSAAGRWEFPGGKVEPWESTEEAIVREIQEELGCAITVDHWLEGEAKIANTHVLIVARATLADGEPTPAEHDLIRWLSLAELDDVPWLDSDLPFLPELRAILA